MKSNLSSIKEIVSDLSKGKMVVIVDDENRENEGDLIFSASHVNPEKINFMIEAMRPIGSKIDADKGHHIKPNTSLDLGDGKLLTQPRIGD